MRFSIARTPTWRWLLMLFGATKNRSYLEVSGEAVEVRFGFFTQHIPLTEVHSAAVYKREVPWYQYSIGWRTNLRGGVGLIGAAKDIVRLELSPPRRVSILGWPVNMKELYVSLEQPDQFVGALKAAGVRHAA